jgi:hypothetical protein
VVQINSELMREIDGPMLQHGLQEMDGRGLVGSSPFWGWWILYGFCELVFCSRRVGKCMHV